MNDTQIPAAVELTPEVLERIRGNVLGTINHYEQVASDLYDQANLLIQDVTRANAERLEAAQLEAARLRQAALIQSETARKLSDAVTQELTPKPQPPQRRPAWMPGGQDPVDSYIPPVGQQPPNGVLPGGPPDGRVDVWAQPDTEGTYAAMSKAVADANAGQATDGDAPFLGGQSGAGSA